MKIKNHEEFCNEVKVLHGDHIKILNTYEKLNTRIEFEYICDKHGKIFNNYSASTLLYSKTFQPCKKCTKEKMKQEKLNNLTGLSFGSWKVIEYDNKSMWKCQCQCGKIKIISGQSLKEGTSKSCGCDSYFHLIGIKIGRLTVLGDVKNGNGKRILCECECGTKKYILVSNLKKENGTKSCGCLTEERIKKVKENGLVDITGKTYGKWTVIKYAGKSKWWCKCECGNEKKVSTASLNQGDTQSCGKCFENQTGSNFFDIINTEEKAYILGLLYADGYNNEKRKTSKT